MGRGLHLGKILGIDIHLDLSWVFIFVLVTWSLGAGVFPSWHPDWGLRLIWGMAISASLLFFASILAHEMSHSLVARSVGLPVRRITLFLFGGVSNIEREPTTPGNEFLIAVVGPVTSFAIGVVFLMTSWLLTGGLPLQVADPAEVFSRLSPIETLLLWLGTVNIMVGLFNLAPGFPLDGGRILRSIVWMATGDLRKATRWASGSGQVLAWLMIIAGFAMAFGTRLPILGSGLINGLWLIFIGWFLNQAALAGYRQVVIRDLLEDVTVASLMKKDVPTVPINMTVSDLINDRLLGTDYNAFPVMDGDRLVGLVSFQDVRGVPRDRWETGLVSEIMKRLEDLDTVDLQQDAGEALEKLTRRDVSQMPVTQNGNLVGLLRRRDIIRWLQLQADFIRH